MDVYVEKGVTHKNSEGENELDVNLLLYVRRDNQEWKQPERILRTKLGESLEKIAFGNQVDRHTEVDRSNPRIPVYHYFHAYQGHIEESRLQEIIEYCKSKGIGVNSYIPSGFYISSDFQFKPPFKH